GGLGSTGLAQDGEVEDYILTIAQDLAVNLPTGNGTNRISVRQNGTNVEIFDLTASAAIATSPLALTNSVTVRGSGTEVDEMTVDYSFGGFFSLPGGIQLDGGAGGGDLLTVTGTNGSVTTTATYVSQGLSLGNATLEFVEGQVTSEIRFTNFEPLTINNVSLLEVAGVLNVGADTLTVNANSFVKLGLQTNLLNGKIVAPSGVTLTAGQTIHGKGMITGKVAADVGSTIEATGPLSMGDAASPDGFFSRGELRVLGNIVGLLDSNQAVLGSITRLGNAGVAGTLNAAHGLVLDFGNNIVGFGTVNTPNDVLRPVINNGAISGNSATEKITLTGYVKGVGSLDNVNITGTNSPGFSPATVYYGSASYGATGKLVAELGGTSGGAYDRQIYSGTADLAGTLDIELINGYQAEVGDSFTLITAAGGVHGTFSSQTLPSLPEFWSWQLAYGTNDLKTIVVTSRPWHNSRKGLDVTNDGHIAPEDPLEVINCINALGSGALPAPHNYVAPFIDVDGDNNVSPNDALEVINAINAGLGGEGEAGPRGQGTGDREQRIGFDELTQLLALDVASQPKRRNA
ncbi:MAG TPA: dockerin type I domain-containing protein, partial [Pirellulaceae bacterium]|nr:dockerin type I domain-containing protein [Pirellulaceae bacterium]